METKRTVKPYPAELRERAVRMVREQAREHASEWAAMRSVAAKVGCTAETLRQWVRQAERDRGERGGLTSEERARLKALERENRELRQADRILRDAGASPATACGVAANGRAERRAALFQRASAPFPDGVHPKRTQRLLR